MVKSAAQGVSMGVGVRVIVDGRTGYGFEELVREMVDEACRAVGAGHARPVAIPASNVYNWLLRYTSMRTNIVIDDKLMRATLRATGLKTKRDAVDQALRTLLRLRKQAQIRRLRGKLDWQGDLDAMRSDS
jgi:Arc/MetJ family transcription regulator